MTSYLTIRNKKQLTIGIIGFIVIPLVLIGGWLFAIRRPLFIGNPQFFLVSERYHFSVTNLPFYLHYTELPQMEGVMVALSPHEFVFDSSVLHPFPQDRRVHYNHSLYFFLVQTARAVVNHNQQVSNETLMGYANRIFESVIALYHERGIERPEPPEIWFSFTPDNINPRILDYVDVSTMKEFFYLHELHGHIYNAVENHIWVSYFATQDIHRYTRNLGIALLVTFGMTLIVFKWAQGFSGNMSEEPIIKN